MKTRQRIVKNGNAAHVAIPKRLMEYLRWRTGQAIIVELTPMNTIELRVPTLADNATPGPPQLLDATLPGVAR